MNADIYIYILVMAAVTYLIRLLPLTILTREIKSVFLRSFLYYVPFVTLAVMTFPAILDAAGNPLSSFAGFLAAVFFAYRGSSLFKVSVFACAAVFLVELFIC